MVTICTRRAAVLALGALTMLSISKPAESAEEMMCRQAVENAWQGAGVAKSNVVSATARERSPGGKMPEPVVHARLTSCSGMLVVNLSKMCHVRGDYTTGNCRLPAVPAYP